MIPVTLVWALLSSSAAAPATPSAAATAAAGASADHDSDEAEVMNAVLPPLTLAPDDAADKEELPAWKGTLTIGGKYTGGNTNTRSITSQLDAERRAEMDRWTFKAWWNYGQEKTNGSNRITTRNEGGSIKYDYFVTKKLYYLAIAGAEADSLADLDLRYYGGAGAGYQFLEGDKTSFLGELALTYFAEKFSTGTDNSTVALRVAYKLSHKLSDTTKIEQDLTLFPSVEKIDDFYGKLDTRLRADLTKSMFAQLQNIIDYDNTPAPGAKRLDDQILLTVGWSF